MLRSSLSIAVLALAAPYAASSATGPIRRGMASVEGRGDHLEEGQSEESGAVSWKISVSWLNIYCGGACALGPIREGIARDSGRGGSEWQEG